MTDDQRAECLQLYMDGARIEQLALEYDRDRTIIQRLVKAAGVKRGHRYRPKGVRYGGRRSRPTCHEYGAP